MSPAKQSVVKKLEEMLNVGIVEPSHITGNDAYAGGTPKGNCADFSSSDNTDVWGKPRGQTHENTVTWHMKLNNI